MNTLPRNVKIDWLRFQVEFYRVSFFRELRNMIGLPFQKKQVSLQDARETNIMALNKVWHEVYDFHGSWIGINFPPSGTETEQPHKCFVDLNGSTLSALYFNRVSALLYYSKLEARFISNRIDIALDFPVEFPRLFSHDWESFIEDGLLYGYRTVKRIATAGRTLDGTTVYLGSRQSTKFVRIYAKLIDDVEYDRLEIEFKGDRADWIMEQLANIPVDEFPKFLNSVVFGEIKFTRQHQNIEFFKKYQRGAINVPPPTLHLDIQKSIDFIKKHSATLAMIHEFMGFQDYDNFISGVLKDGKLRMKIRHRLILSNAKFMGVTLSLFLLFFCQLPAVASGLTCPAPVPLSFGIRQKFPVDIVTPTPSEQAYLDNVGDGCFQVYSGLNFDRICLPGMIVNALRPFVIMGLGLRFIFSD